MRICSKCGKELSEELNFCIECGGKTINKSTNDDSKKACSKCGTQNNYHNRFCSECGSALDQVKEKGVICHHCGIINSDGLKFCIECGTPLKTETPNQAPNSVASYQIHNEVARKNSSKTKRLIPIIAALLIICVFTFVYKDNILNIFNSNDYKTSKPTGVNINNTNQNENSSDIKYDPVAMPVSGTKALEISPIDGLTISAEENALDKERSFTVKQLDDNELEGLINQLPTPDMFPLRAFDVDSGMKLEEQFSGVINLTFDLDVLDIPEEFRADLKVVRLGDTTPPTVVPSVVNDSKITVQSEKNCLFAICLALSVGGAIVATYDTLEKNGYVNQDRGIKNIINSDLILEPWSWTDSIKGYTVYWPKRMPAANPEEVKRQNDKLIGLYNQYGIEVDVSGSINKILKLKNGDSDSKKIAEKLKELFQDEEYKKTSALIKSEEWQKENVWPFVVQESIKQLKIADKYLFEYRGFKKQSSTDILLMDKWPVPAKKNEEMGSSKNTYTRRPYLHMNLEYGGVNHNAADYQKNKWWYDELLITFTHELFHVSQVRYLSLMSIDSKDYTWFWEATAITLQEEASKYYKEHTGIADKNYSGDIDTHLGMCRFPLAYFTGYDDPKDLQNQGYAYSYLIEFLRDEYAAKMNVKPDQFLKLIMERFAITKDAVKTLSDQISKNKSAFRYEYERFCKQKAELFVSVPDKGLGIPNIEYTLKKSNPFYEVIAKSSPLSTVAKKFTVLENLESKQDVALVVRADKDTIGFANDISLRRKVGNQNVFKYLIEPKGYTGQLYDIKIPSSDVSYSVKFPQLYLHEIHFYDVKERADSKYSVFAMFKPLKPEVEKVQIGESMNKLKIINKKGILFDKGFVDKFIVSIICPSGELYKLETNKEEIQIPLSFDQFSIDTSQLSSEIKIKSVEKSSFKADDDENAFYISVNEVTNTDSMVVGPESDKTKIAVNPRIILTADAKEAYIKEKVNYTVNIQNKDFQYIWTMGDGFEVEGSFNLEYVFEYTGNYVTVVSVRNKEGKEIGTDSWELEIVEEPVATPEPQEEEKQGDDELQYGKKSDANDPYRKYDEGFVKYDYSLLAYKESEYMVTYHNWKLNEPEGMYITFYDKENTKPWRIEYQMRYSDKLYEHIGGFGDTSFDEEGNVENRSRSTFDGTYAWHTSTDYFTNGDIQTEVIDRIHPSDNSKNLYIQKYYKYTKTNNKLYMYSESHYVNGTFIKGYEYSEDDSDGYVYLYKTETKNSDGELTTVYTDRNGEPY